MDVPPTSDTFGSQRGDERFASKGGQGQSKLICPDRQRRMIWMKASLLKANEPSALQSRVRNKEPFGSIDLTVPYQRRQSTGWSHLRRTYSSSRATAACATS